VTSPGIAETRPFFWRQAVRLDESLAPAATAPNGNVVPERADRGVLLVFGQEYSEHAKVAFGGFVDEMHFHRKLLTMHFVFIVIMEVELQQVEATAIEAMKLPAWVLT
jgi:hypothetical protein